MMKTLRITLFLCLMVLISACERVPEDTVDVKDPIAYLDIYYLNDLHGAILPDQNSMGMAYIGNFLRTQKENNPEQTIILAGGDMLQGSALSNITYGRSIVELMDATYFDAFVIGNHEFDWGLDKVTRYYDGKTDDAIAAHVLLGANVFYKGTKNLPDGIDPYVILERGHLRIGIIGTMGYGLESSILAPHVEDYTFADPGPIVKDYAYYLRTEESVDIVILLTHDVGNVNADVVDLEGDYRIDAIFNAHHHQAYTRYENGVPVMQSGANGSHVGHMQFTFDDRTIETVTMTNLNQQNEPLLNTASLDIDILIQDYILENMHIFDTIAMTDTSLSRGDLTYWMAELIRVATASDVGIHNYGGTRAEIQAYTGISLNTLYSVFPFDNSVMTVSLTGEQLEQYLYGSSNRYYNTLIETFEFETLYTVATNDFLFYNPYHPFQNGEHAYDTGLYIRDLAVDELQLQHDLFGTFDLNNPMLIPTYTEGTPEEDQLDD